MKRNSVRNAHVRPGLPRARQAEADLAVQLHDPEGHDAIRRELVACTLGHRQRLELRTDLAGKIAHAAISMRRFLAAAKPPPAKRRRIRLTKHGL